ncbi:hypothetical protein BDZ89DRAFT_1150725 [Hymenopellis radicata]|nr:hypothetical protein BDZ89DRAFT_1150725 [Hymenopellis radicata]
MLRNSAWRRHHTFDVVLKAHSSPDIRLDVPYVADTFTSASTRNFAHGQTFCLPADDRSHLRVTKHRKALIRLLFSEQLRRADRAHPLVPRDERLYRLCGLAVESPEPPILICTGDSDLVDIRTAAVTLLDPQLPYLNLARLPTDDGGALVLLRALIFQDTCLPLVAKLIYDTMELLPTYLSVGRASRLSKSIVAPSLRAAGRFIRLDNYLVNPIRAAPSLGASLSRLASRHILLSLWHDITTALHQAYHQPITMMEGYNLARIIFHH